MTLPGTPPEPSPHDEVDEEIRFHLERKVERLIARGMPRAEAEREAARRFGNVEEVRMKMRSEVRRRRRSDRVRQWFDEWSQDVRFAARQWRRNPGFTLVVVLTLALGIGANTAIFSVVDHVLLRPLPYPEADRLGVLWTDVSRRGGPADEWLSYANFVDVVEGTPAVAEGALWGGFNPTLTGRGEAMAVSGAVVTEGMFSRVLQVEPVIGRGFLPDDDRPGAPNVLVVAHDFWRDVLGAPPEVAGTTVLLNDVSYEVVGVMPADFRPPFVPDARIWAAPQLDPVAQAQNRGGFSWRSVVRLAPGADFDAARTAIDGLAARLESDHPQSNTDMGFALLELRDDMVADARTGLWVVLGSVVLLLVVACVNVANLLLARATSRTAELSVRSALGARRSRLVRQMVAESVGLALLGGALGVLLGVVGTRLLVALAPAGTPRIESVAVDLRILAVTTVVAVGAGILFGLAPALQVSGRNLQSRLREEGRAGLGGRSGLRLRNALVAAQVALALVVLVGAGLLTRSFDNLRTVDLGFEPDRALSFFVNLPVSRYPEGDEIRPAIREFEQRLAAVPGVERVGTINSLPLSGFDGDATFFIEGRTPPPPGQESAAWLRRVTPDYREAAGLRLLSGRWIESVDEAGGVPVALVNETLVERHFPGENPIGRRIDFGEPGGALYEIVGVVADIRHFSIRDDRREAVYLSFDQVPTRSAFVVVRAAEGRDPALLAPEVRRVVSDLDPSLAAQRITPMAELVADALAADRFLTTLLNLFAAATLVLAVVGLYGVVSVSVGARLRELGVRMALGAEASGIAGLVVRRALLLVGIGVGAGVVLAFMGTPVLASLLYGVRADDPLTFLLVAGVLVTVAAGAAAVPAWRASRVDPVKVLRAE